MKKAVVIGGGPAGLMASEVLAAGSGIDVHVHDAMPSVGRKFLLAGKGGMNLTHSEPLAQFVTRYGARQRAVQDWLQGFGPEALRSWAESLGIATFVGSSGRVFPTDMKAAPLLRAWLHRLRSQGVKLHMRQRWHGWADDGRLLFDTPQGSELLRADAVVLALGGASWPRLGSDGAWAPLLRAQGVEVAPLQPANCGFDVAGGWTPYFSGRFAGHPFKSVAITVRDEVGRELFHRKGEFVATATGVEGSLVYAASAWLREEIAARGVASFTLDLLPGRTPAQVLADVTHPRGSRSLSSHLKSRLALDGIKLALVHELCGKEVLADAPQLARALKALPVRLSAPRPLAEAISTAGGVRLEGLDASLMLQARPGTFCAGEMLDWEAPTGGYLLTACLASGLRAGQGARRWLEA